MDKRLDLLRLQHLVALRMRGLPYVLSPLLLVSVATFVGLATTAVRRMRRFPQDAAVDGGFSHKGGDDRMAGIDTS
jgi:hypothetical protein